MKPTFDLRPHQIAAIKSFYDAKRAGHRSQIFCLPTGAGKTYCAMEIISHLVKFDKRVNFLVDRDVLVRQTSSEFQRNGIRHGVAAGANTFGRHEAVQVISQQTATSRALPLNHADLNIIDECHVSHRYVASKIKQGGNWLGLSASPFRKGLAELYSNVINVTTTDRLVQEGWLSPLKIYCGVPIEVSKKTNSGEYDVEAAAEATMAIIGDIVQEWEEKTNEHFGGPVKTIVFSNSVADGEELARQFQARGHDFRAVSYLTEQEEKNDLIAMLRDGEIMGIISCMMLQRGFDVPDILCGIDAHPWRKSLSSVVQQCGRGMRIAPDKEYCLWLDPAQNLLRHKDRVMDFWMNGLDELVPMDNVAGEDQPDRNRGVCPKCKSILTGSACLQCGWERPVPTHGGIPMDGPDVVNGKLIALDLKADKPLKVQVGKKLYQVPPPLQGWNEICFLAQAYGKDQRWCQAQYRNLYGEFRRARYDPANHYPPSTMDLRAAIDHSKKLYVERRKRERAA